MAQTDPKEDFLQWVHEIVQERGPKWSLIAQLAADQGYEEDGKTPSSNAIRKRYGRWKRELGEESFVKAVETEEGKVEKVSKGKEPLIDLKPFDRKDYDQKHQQYALVDVEQLRKSIWEEVKSEPPAPQQESRREDSISARETLDLIRESMERRDSMLLEQIRKDNTTTDQTVILEVEKRMGHQLTQMQERLEALESRIASFDVADSVDEALQDMLTPGGSFEKHVMGLVSQSINQKVSGDLGTLLQGITVRTEPKAGPGRGKKADRPAARFSATIDADIYDRVKSLGGVLSQHIEAACELYLRALEGSKKPHTDRAVPQQEDLLEKTDNGNV